MNSGIYKITNIANNKIYIGSSINIIPRWRVHKSDLNLNRHDNSYLQNAWNKYWPHNFKFEILELCKIEDLIAREQHWMDFTKCCDRKFGYNIAKIAGNTLNYKHSEETKAKMKNRIVSTETRKLLSDFNKDRTPSEETKLKISEKLKNIKRSEETKHKMALGKLKENNPNRNVIEWPCDEGYYCNCDVCKNKRKLYHKNYNDARKNKCDVGQII